MKELTRIDVDKEIYYANYKVRNICRYFEFDGVLKSMTLDYEIRDLYGKMYEKYSIKAEYFRSVEHQDGKWRLLLNMDRGPYEFPLKRIYESLTDKVLDTIYKETFIDCLILK